MLFKKSRYSNFIFFDQYCDGAKLISERIKKKNLNCKIKNIHHFFRINQASILRFLTYEINEINENYEKIEY